jgi:glycosyltransferase involved in cell wall biosynthesis
MPKFSIIVPVYKVGNYIDQCLNSIRNQTFPDFEAIVIDDGSPDNAPSICDLHAQKDSRIKVIHKSNGGVSSALNAGLQEATGDWIYFVDGDDWIELNTLEVINNNLTRYPEIDILGFNNFFNETDREYQNKKAYPVEKILSSIEISKFAEATLFPKWIERKYKYSLPTVRERWSKVFRRNLIYSNKLLFKTDLTTGQDAFFILESFLCASKVVMTNDFLYHYRITNNSAIHRYRENWNHFFARLNYTKRIMESYNLDYSTSYGLLFWNGLRSFLENFLFHKECSLTFKQKREALKQFFDQIDSKDIHLKFELLRVLPTYFPIILFIKYRCLVLTLFLGKIFYGRGK